MESQEFTISIPGESVVYSNLFGNGYMELATFKGRGHQVLMSVGDRKPQRAITLDRLSMTPEWRATH